MAHQIDESKPKYLSQTRFMSGRRIIKTSVTEITDENVVDVLRKALATHELNRSEIDYLWKYYRGDQPIRNRVKDVRPEICNKITENRANEIVSFKVGYLCGEPIQYVSRNGGEEMQKNTTAWEKLIDIKEFPDLGGAPEMLETTTLSDKMQTYIPGIQSLDSLEFTANYTLEEYKKLKALEGAEKEFAVWFGGTEAGDVVTPTGDSGKFKFKGFLSVYANGGGTNEVVEMTITIAPSSPISMDAE